MTTWHDAGVSGSRTVGSLGVSRRVSGGQVWAAVLALLAAVGIAAGLSSASSERSVGRGWAAPPPAGDAQPAFSPPSATGPSSFRGALAADRSPLPLSTARRKQLASGYGRLPLSFEQNRGQSDPQIKFISRGAGYALGLSNRGPVLALAQHSARRDRVSTAVLAMSFVGGSRRARLITSGRLAGKVNYLIGNDRQRWHTGVPTYSGVTYQRVWRGIDATFYGNQRRLEYDFRVRPGADARRIVLRFSGARSLRIDRRGDLVIAMHGGSVTQLAPRAYQAVGERRGAVASRYVVMPRGRVAVRVGAYDHRRALVIDPALAYASYLGGTGADFGFGIGVDASGSAYAVGPTSSTDFPTTAGALQTTNGAGTGDTFVTKFNPAGTAVVYSTYLGGGSGSVSGGSTVVDASGSAYVVGLTNSTGFPVTAGAAQPTLAGATDAFVAKLNPAGSALTYATYIGGSAADYGYGIALDGSGSAYVSGYTASANFPVTAGAAQPTYGGGGSDAFIAKLNPAGSAFDYATYLGGSGGDYSGISGIAVDGGGNAYVTGQTASTNFPVTAGAFQVIYGGGTNDVFVAKVNPAGSAFAYVTYLGGSDNDTSGVGGIAVDGIGDAYVTGSTYSSNFPVTVGAFQTASAGGIDDAFVTKLNPGGSALVYSSYLGGSAGESGSGIAVDASGSAYVSGSTNSTDFPVTDDAAQHDPGGAGDAFVTKLNPAGSALAYSTYLGGTGGEFGNAIAIDGRGDAYVDGTVGSTDFPVTVGAFQATKAAKGDAFIAKVPTRRSTSTTVACVPPAAPVGTATSCTATVTDTDVGATSALSGAVSFTASQTGRFAPSSGCVLVTTGTIGHCQVTFTPGVLGAGTQTITAGYVGDANHASGSASTPLIVTPGRPKVTHYRLTNRSFVVGRGSTPRFASAARRRASGTTFEYTLSEPARVRIVISRLLAGRRSGKRCTARIRRLRHARLCVRMLSRGTLTRSSHPDANRVAFSGRVGSKALEPGRYSATLTATDGSNQTSKPVTVYFTIVIA